MMPGEPRDARGFPIGRARRGRRLAVALLVVAGLVFATHRPAASGEEQLPAASSPDEAVSSEAPYVLQGIDLAAPAQAAFAEWPTDAMRRRLYRHPWNRVSFQRAKLHARPIVFVMAVPWSRAAQRFFSETLSDPAVLDRLNDGYITVVVDADRRPDIRERYQTGAMPTVAFLLPDGRPMLSQANPKGVAMPITAGFVKPEGMLFLLDEARVYWERWSSLLEGLGDYWAKRESEARNEPGPVADGASDVQARWLLGNHDKTAGGFGPGSKFPVPGLAEYASLREARFAPALTDPVLDSLKKMLASPLWDRKDGGVHRLAGDPEWTGIEYEKLLRVNAILLRDLAFACRGRSDPDLRAKATATGGFITTTLGRPGGGFYLAQNADSRSTDGGAYWNAPPGSPLAPPPVDRLVLSGPNALAGAALLRAGALLEDERLETSGRRALEEVLARAYRPGRGVAHVIEPGSDERRYLESQADVAFGLVDAYESTGEPRYLAAARDIVDFARNNLIAPGSSVFSDSIPEAAPLGILGNVRTPLSENVTMARAMLRLTHHGLGEEYRAAAIGVLGSYSGNLAVYGVHGTLPALGIEEIVRDPVVIRIEGSRGDARTRALRRAAVSSPWPWTVVGTGDENALEPGAVVSLGGRSARAADAAALAEAITRVSRGVDEEPAR